MPDQVSCDHDPLRAHTGLIVLAVALPVVELALLAGWGLEPAAGLAPQASAPPPFGAFHDVRWLLAFHPSWPAFVAELAALVAVRGALIGTLVRAAWPRPDRPPPWRVTATRGVSYTAGATLLVVPWAGYLFALAVVPVSWLFAAGVVPFLVLALVGHRGAVAGQWWQLPTRRTLSWTLVTAAVLTAGGAATAAAPLPAAFLAAAATGLWSAWAWHGLVHALVCRDRDSTRRPLAPAAAAVVVALMAGTTAIAFDALAGAPPADEPVVAEDGPPVLVAGGFATSFDGSDADLLPPPYRDVRFSYRGVSPSGRPLPYDAEDTAASLPVLARRMAQQVRLLHADSGQPVDIVAESEGAFVAQMYVTAADDPPVGRVVLLSPLLHPARVHYPPAGADGWGVAGGWVLRAVSWVVSELSPFEARPDSPFIRSLVEHAPVTRRFLTCAPEGVDEVILLPLSDTVGLPMRLTSQVPIHVVPAFHAGFLRGDAAPVTALLAGRPPPTTPVSRPIHYIGRALAQAWHVPVVPLGLAWDADVDDDCDDVERAVTDLVAATDEGQGLG